MIAQRDVSATLEVFVAAPCEIEMRIAVARVPGIAFRERLSVVAGGMPVTPEEIEDAVGTRVHRFHATGELLDQVATFVRTHTQYIPGTSDPIDSAADTLMAGAGVCRDYAHLTVALLRALNVPARAVAVYAPGCNPMDFHAVTEAVVDGEWVVVDATGLAPRQGFVRIATGRDAADIAFLENHGGSITLNSYWVTASSPDPLPCDDGRSRIAMS